MSDIVQGFLDDIVAHPEDPSLWLILADWLEDQSDPRAELVRLTWSLSYEEDHPDFGMRQSRVQALLASGMISVRPRMTLGGIDFAWIPPGTFWMGSPRDEPQHNADETLHRVTLTRPFWLSVYPVTQAQYAEVTGLNPALYRGQNHPVEQVTYSDGEQFCIELARRTRLDFSLPTEAEWEYACRAGTTTPFHFGGVLNGHQANCDGNYPCGTDIKGPYLQTTRPVGGYPPNAWGIHDMHGNVWEWCQDAYESQLAWEAGRVDPVVRPSDPSQAHVVRGGSWDSYCWSGRSAGRRYFFATFKQYGIVGFRVVFRPD